MVTSFSCDKAWRACFCSSNDIAPRGKRDAKNYFLEGKKVLAVWMVLWPMVYVPVEISWGWGFVRGN